MFPCGSPGANEAPTSAPRASRLMCRVGVSQAPSSLPSAVNASRSPAGAHETGLTERYGPATWRGLLAPSAATTKTRPPTV